MEFKTLKRGETWMDEDERKFVRRLAGDLEKLMARRGVEMTPLLGLRIEELLVSWTLARRVEGTLEERAADGDEAPPAKGPSPFAVCEASGKARERTRRAVKELEEYCAKAGTPIDRGIAEIVKPLMKRAAGVVEEAIAASAQDGRTTE